MPVHERRAGRRGAIKMRRSSRWLGCAAVMCLTVAQLSGCSSKPLVSGFRMPGMKARSSATAKSQKLSTEEAGDLLAQARDFEKQGDFPNAARLYRQYLDGGGEPLRPDSPMLKDGLAKSDSTKPPKAGTRSSSGPRDDDSTKMASRSSTGVPSRTATRTEKKSADKPVRETEVAQKPSPTQKARNSSSSRSTKSAIADDPWADSAATDSIAAADRSRDLPVIRPGNTGKTAQRPSNTVASQEPASSGSRPTKSHVVTDAGIPDWAKGEAGSSTLNRRVTQKELDDLLDLDEGEIDWGDRKAPEAASDNIASELVEPEGDESLVAENDSPEMSSDEDAAPEFEEPIAQDDNTWSAHQDESDTVVTSDDPEGLSPPVAQDETVQPDVSIAALCKDCEPWVYSVAVKLDSHDPEVRKEALTHLADMGSTARQAGLAVRTLLDDAEPLVQAHAAWALWEIENEPLESVTTLNELLDHHNPDVVQLACYMLGDIGPQAESGRHALVLLRDHADGTTRIHAAEAMVRICGTDQASVAVLTNAAQSRDVEERWIAAVALGRCRGEMAPEAVKALLSALHDVDPDVRSAAALSLGGLGRDAESARAELERIAKSDDPQVRDSALAALACLNK